MWLAAGTLVGAVREASHQRSMRVSDLLDLLEIRLSYSLDKEWTHGFLQCPFHTDSQILHDSAYYKPPHFHRPHSRSLIKVSTKSSESNQAWCYCCSHYSQDAILKVWMTEDSYHVLFLNLWFIERVLYVEVMKHRGTGSQKEKLCHSRQWDLQRPQKPLLQTRFVKSPAMLSRFTESQRLGKTYELCVVSQGFGHGPK